MDTKTTSTRMNLVYFATIAFAALPACGPCEAYVETAGTVDLCPGDDSESSGTAGMSTGVDPTGETCDTPGPGELWGPCDIAGGCVLSEVPASCASFDSGWICLPACGVDGCPEEVAACGGGECLVTGACAPACEYGAAPKCPHDGMVCDLSQSDGVCVWPTGETCETADVPGQPFAPCLPDFSCDAAGTICATDDNGWVCVPISSEGCAEEHAACAGSGGFGKGYGAQVDACTLDCSTNGDAQCPAGMVCGTLFGLCVWPN